MGAFLAMAWITIAVSCVSKAPEISFPDHIRKSPWRAWCVLSPELCAKAKELLGPLADIQAVTGLAIVISGYNKIKTMSFYHMDHVNYYWVITMNSFWAAQPAVLDPESDWDFFRLLIRQVAVLAATIIGVTFQGVTLSIENREWDDETSGKCYRVGDPTDTVVLARFWMAGAIIFCFVLTLTTIGLGEYLITLNNLLLLGERFLLKFLGGIYADLLSYKPGFTALRVFRKAYLTVLFFLWALLTFVYLLFVLLMAIWAGLGSEQHASLFMLLVTASLVWNTYGLIAMRKANNSLIEEEETLYGFGQVLPLVMLLQIVFSAVDIWRGKKTQLRPRPQVVCGITTQSAH